MKDEILRCPLCDYPCHNPQGLTVHRNTRHGASLVAERNWDIMHAWRSGVTVGELARRYSLAPNSISGIVTLGLTYPDIYEAEES